MMTGHAPPVQVLDDVGRGMRPAPSHARPDPALSADLDRWVQTALAPRRQDRYATAKPLHEAVVGLRELPSLSVAAKAVLLLPSEPHPSQADPMRTPSSSRRFSSTRGAGPNSAEVTIRVILTPPRIRVMGVKTGEVSCRGAPCRCARAQLRGALLTGAALSLGLR